MERSAVTDRRRALALLLFLVAAAPPALLPAQAPPDGGLALEEAIALARQNNPGFLASANDADVAHWDVRSAYGRLFAPSLSASSSVSWQGSGEQLFGSITDDQLGIGDQPSFYLSSYTLGLDYTLDGSTLLAPGRAKASRRATTARIRSGAVRLEATVTRAYLDVLRQGEGLRLVRQQLERAETNLRLARARRDVGSASDLDVRRAEVEVGRGHVNLLQAEQSVHTARLTLFREMGIDPDPDAELTSRFELHEPGWTEEALYETALDANPSLSELRASHRSADYRVRSARSSYLPSVNVQAGLSGFTREASDPGFFVEQARQRAEQQRQQCEALNELVRRLADPLPPQDCSAFALSEDEAQAIRVQNDAFPFDFTSQPPRASLTVSVPIFQGLGRQREVEAARVEREDARHRIREQELALRAEIGAGVSAVRTAYEAARLEARNQQVADEQLRLAREQYRVGQISFGELVDAETVKAQADRDRVAAVFAYHDALADLEAVVGTSLRGGEEGR